MNASCGSLMTSSHNVRGSTDPASLEAQFEASPAGKPPSRRLADYWAAPVAPAAPDPGAEEVAIRVDLERGRLFNSAGEPAQALMSMNGASRLIHSSAVSRPGYR